MSRRDKWVRRFSVDETARHKNGFTIYKITSVVFPVQSPEAASTVSVWHRWREVSRLHSWASRRHAPPALPPREHFKRFSPEVIEERAKFIRRLLEYIAEQTTLFTSADFVNFLQTGYPDPHTTGVISEIRSSLRLPTDEPRLEYSDDEEQRNVSQTHPLDDSVLQIPIYEAADVERPTIPSPKVSPTNSFDSISSLESLSDDLYSELDKLTVEKKQPMVKKSVLPDLINFDAPSTSRFDDYQNSESETVSLNSTVTSVNVSMSSVNSAISNECKTRTEDSYVFEAGYMLNLAARYEHMGEYQRAFDCYKTGIEKMLVGAQSDTDPSRRALIKRKTDKYLSHAETVYKEHLCDVEQRILPQPPAATPASLLRRARASLAEYRVWGALADGKGLLVCRADDHTCYAMKVIQKIPHNLTEFDEYFLQNTVETRQPILPTDIPYMVTLHSFIETNNLIFLILSYAPGESLFDYIKNYAKSAPTTPAREVNLENVFIEPKIKTDYENDNVDNIEIKKLETDIELKLEIDEVDSRHENISIIERLEANINNNNRQREDKTENEKLEVSVNELVINSQKLLLNVDKALKEVPKDNRGSDETDRSEVKSDRSGRSEVKSDRSGKSEVKRVSVSSVQNVQKRRVETPQYNRLPRDVIPPSAISRWGAEILTALESLHNAGVVCLSLPPSKLVLGAGGHALLTYTLLVPSWPVLVSRVCRDRDRCPTSVAPELGAFPPPEGTLHLADYWCFGGAMYHLICGVPLCEYHKSAFTSHTILQLPDGLTVDEESLLTQLLTYAPSERLGSGKDGIEEIKRHPYFRHIDWQRVYQEWLHPH